VLRLKLSLSVRAVAQEERGRVAKFVHLDDRKRSLVSLLLQRWACEQALGVPFRSAELHRTKGGKPFLTARLLAAQAWPVTDGNSNRLVHQAEGAPRPGAAANWNFNVSHEGDFVVLASEPLCVCGVDVAAPAQLRRKGAEPPPMRQFVTNFSRQLTSRELQQILTAGSEGE
jgi:4'-phosphopantetheinyl transferase